MRLLVDTNRYADMDAGVPEVVERFESASELWLSLIVLGELYAGFVLGGRKESNEKNLRGFLNKPSVGVLFPNEETARYYGDIFQAVRRQGTPLPTNDLWIAAQALQHDLTLDTRDQHFQHVPGLKLVLPLE
ncbi:MAG: type II toxin-antitoxin system VapC family toxin [Planctomycetes bacterium]|nr:type II toxin-antitoxin system VapC family toxin [Planctomycetota bacterium]